MRHYHVWTRSGTTFILRPKRFNTRAAAFKAACKLRAAPADRLVLACDDCPRRAARKRRPVRWSAIARAVGLPYSAAARLRAAYDAERARETPDSPAPDAASPNAARDAGPDEAQSNPAPDSPGYDVIP